VSEQDATDLLSLLERHPEASVKVGIGVDHFEVRVTEFKNNSFYIVRTNGTGTDFSFRTCVKSKAPTIKQDVLGAFRAVVIQDKIIARDVFFRANKAEDGLYVCAQSGKRIRPEEGHIDHLPPMTFEVIVETFLAGRGMRYEDVLITPNADNQTSPALTDTKLTEAFRKYHGTVAKLDFVKASVNLSQASKHRIKCGRLLVAA
jgi:Protein of unknown function (DUF3223)